MLWVQPLDWTAAQADAWTREDWLAIVLSPLSYMLIMVGLALALHHVPDAVPEQPAAVDRDHFIDAVAEDEAAIQRGYPGLGGGQVIAVQVNGVQRGTHRVLLEPEQHAVTHALPEAAFGNVLQRDQGPLRDHAVFAGVIKPVD